MHVYQHHNSGTIHLVEGCQGATEQVRLCNKCATALVKQNRIRRLTKSPEDASFQLYKEAEDADIEPPHVKIYAGGDKLKFGERAQDLAKESFYHVKVFISEDGTMVGLKPVSGPNVDENCLSVKGSRMYFQGIMSKLDFEFEYNTSEAAFEVAWDDDRDMYVIDFTSEIELSGS